MHSRSVSIVAVGILLVAFAATSRACGEPIVTSDLLRIRSVSSIEVSRDGHRAVFAVRSIAENPAALAGKPEPAYCYQQHLFLLDLTDAHALPRQLTFGDRLDSNPKLSPDGRRIAFVRDAAGKSEVALAAQPPEDGEPTSQIWIIPVDGGEARQVTTFKNGCTSASWSPDGSRLLISSRLKLDEIEGVPPWPMDRPKRTWKDAILPEGVQPDPSGSRQQIRAWLERNAEQLRPNTISRLEYQDELSLRGTMRFTHLYIVDPDGPTLPLEQGSARRLTNGFFNHEEAAFMPDGRSVVYASKKPSDQHLDRVLNSGLWQINADGTGDRAILAQEGWSFRSPKPSRDGTVVAFIGQQMDEPAFRQQQLGLIQMGAEAVAPAWLTNQANFASSVDAFEWLHAQPALLFTAAYRGAFPLYSISPGLIEPFVLVNESNGMPVGVNVFASGGGSIVYSATSPANPCVLMVRDGRGDRQAYDLNPWVANKSISLPIAGEIVRPDNTKVQYWLMEPTGRVAGKKYPLVLNMHGGPSAMWGPGEFTMWHEFQLLCSWGFGVVHANPRGSGGYGYEFQRANFQDWGEGPAGDVLAAVDEALLKGWADREKLLITGGSYAGYLTAWIVAHDHRFKAAVAQRGVYDFNTFFGEGNAWRLVRWAMGGFPYDARVQQVISRNNPFNHVSRIRTPLLIMHASQDLRTGVSQSEMMYRALKEMGRPVEYVRYPESGHDLSRTGDPTLRMDRLNRMIEFFERFIENDRPAPAASGQ